VLLRGVFNREHRSVTALERALADNSSIVLRGA
jgi:hypothetical protein